MALTPRSPIFAVLVLMLLSACSTTRYYYRATDPTPLTPRGLSGVTYEIVSPQGLVRMAALGMRKVPAFSRDPVFVVRYYIENRSGVDWRIDPAGQRITFDRRDASGEQNAQSAQNAQGSQDTQGSHGGQPPIGSSLDAGKTAFDAKNGRAQILDLVFAVPPSSGGEPAMFRLEWRIDAAGQIRMGRAAFEKWEIPPGSAETNYLNQENELNFQSGQGTPHRSH